MKYLLQEQVCKQVEQEDFDMVKEWEIGSEVEEVDIEVDEKMEYMVGYVEG